MRRYNLPGERDVGDIAAEGVNTLVQQQRRTVE
jgi:hypothetical protein